MRDDHWEATLFHSPSQLWFLPFPLSSLTFLDVSSHLCKIVCPFVRPCVRPLPIQKNRTSDASFCPPGVVRCNYASLYKRKYQSVRRSVCRSLSLSVPLFLGPSARPYVSGYFRTMNMVIDKVGNSSNDIIHIDAKSDEEVVASDGPLRHLSSLSFFFAFILSFLLLFFAFFLHIFALSCFFFLLAY